MKVIYNAFAFESAYNARNRIGPCEWQFWYTTNGWYLGAPACNECEWMVPGTEGDKEYGDWG